jgi:deoxyribonuclease-1
MLKITSLIFISIPFISYADNDVANSWGKTKELARDEVYKNHTITMYCDCTYSPKGKSGGVIDSKSCGYDKSGGGYKNRAETLEWEHVVPAYLMPAREFSCWTDGSRANCEKTLRKLVK